MGGKSRGLCHHLGGVHIQCVSSFLTEKGSTRSMHESKQMWSIWIWRFCLDLFFICSLQCSWNYWGESDRLEFGLASGAFDPFSSYLSNLHRQMPALPPKTPCMQGLYQSVVPLEHLCRTCLQKCVSRQIHSSHVTLVKLISELWHRFCMNQHVRTQQPWPQNFPSQSRAGELSF